MGWSFRLNSSFGGFERPLVITEKNKIVKGRNKQNQLKMDLDRIGIHKDLISCFKLNS